MKANAFHYTFAAFCISIPLCFGEEMGFQFFFFVHETLLRGSESCCVVWIMLAADDTRMGHDMWAVKTSNLGNFS